MKTKPRRCRGRKLRNTFRNRHGVLPGCVQVTNASTAQRAAQRNATRLHLIEQLSPKLQAAAISAMRAKMIARKTIARGK